VGVLATLIWSVLLSVIIIKVVQAVIGLRVSVETEELGIDAKVHGERGYNM
jgi:Amt family ammonium transporter